VYFAATSSPQEQTAVGRWKSAASFWLHTTQIHRQQSKLIITGIKQWQHLRNVQKRPLTPVSIMAPPPPPFICAYTPVCLSSLSSSMYVHHISVLLLALNGADARLNQHLYTILSQSEPLAFPKDSLHLLLSAALFQSSATGWKQTLLHACNRLCFYTIHGLLSCSTLFQPTGSSAEWWFSP